MKLSRPDSSLPPLASCAAAEGEQGLAGAEDLDGGQVAGHADRGQEGDAIEVGAVRIGAENGGLAGAAADGEQEQGGKGTKAHGNSGLGPRSGDWAPGRA
jgi:hypothetical protein